MGLTIIGDVVTVDQTHGRLLNTNVQGNPTLEIIDGLKIYSVFERRKEPRISGKTKNKKGDNCHLLYALKEKDGLSTTISSIKVLLPPFREILRAFPVGYDLIIPMPSRYSIVDIVANRFSRHFECPVEENCLEKVSARSALQSLNAMPICRADKKSLEHRLKAQLSKGDGSLSLKEIPVHFRNFFNPVAITKALQGDFGKILLVDDLLATGTTLVSARNLIQAKCPKATIEAACLFSKVA